ncbi:MAG: thiamine pyrophosphate-dependent dehydrogenase E1 component subunit alpha [Anaerofustis stercorihominis]|nr:thiamine pyrophosphate-dependent dehydrogenase E1 component subunit alpha [Anaerofustis stercorihominis]
MDNQTMIQVYYKMLTTRFFEKQAAMLSEMNIVTAPMYLCCGSEGVVSAVAALSEDDAIFAGHRNTSVLIGCECEIEDMFTELLGGTDGYLGGKSGLSSYCDSGVNFFGSTRLPASQFSVAVGAAMAKKLQGENSVVVCFAGDGACCDGTFYEALNMAGVYELPIIFFIENNGYAGKMQTKGVIDCEDIAIRANGFNVKAIMLKGNDPVGIYNAVKTVRDYTIKNGPVIIEAKTNVRYASVYGEDTSYMKQEDINNALIDDPINAFSEYILEKGLLNKSELTAIKEKAKAEVESALDRVLGSMGIEISDSEVV